MINVESSHCVVVNDEVFCKYLTLCRFFKVFYSFCAKKSMKSKSSKQVQDSGFILCSQSSGGFNPIFVLFWRICWNKTIGVELTGNYVVSTYGNGQ